MTGLVRKSDSDGKVSYFTIVGMNEDDCFGQVSELSRHSRQCDTGNRFYLVATRKDGVWYDIEGKPLSDAYVRTYLE